MRPLIASILILSAWTVSIAVPQPQYQSTDYLSHISIPHTMPHWISRDISGSLNIRDKRYAFMSKVIAREYRSDLGESLLLLIMDTSNFHNPQICFEGTGFTVNVLPSRDLGVGVGSIRPKLLMTQKGKESTLVVYWMTMDGQPIDWAQGKLKELLLNIFGKKRSGLMCRLDIACQPSSVDVCIDTASDFLDSINSHLNESDTKTVFGI